MVKANRVKLLTYAWCTINNLGTSKGAVESCEYTLRRTNDADVRPHHLRVKDDLRNSSRLWSPPVKDFGTVECPNTISETATRKMLAASTIGHTLISAAKRRIHEALGRIKSFAPYVTQFSHRSEDPFKSRMRSGSLRSNPTKAMQVGNASPASSGRLKMSQCTTESAPPGFSSVSEATRPPLNLSLPRPQIPGAPGTINLRQRSQAMVQRTVSAEQVFVTTQSSRQPSSPKSVDGSRGLMPWR
eukprot:GHVO01026909.1.p1 GENE.GHVO01026909.1~~GHVO01026909.1.p1  ORF type:complete len:257 (+),score=25.58 GHVO01026909.1:42-773(+)